MSEKYISLSKNFFPTTIGFDRAIDLLLNLQQGEGFDSSTHNYPPFNIIKTGDNDYELHMAVAGFKKEDLNVTVTGRVLSVSGSSKKEANSKYLHQGLSTRSFKRTFTISDTINIVESKLEDGVLVVKMKHEVPEELKPKEIQIL